MKRSRHIEEFLQRAGWGDAVRQPLAGDASFRRYVRLLGGPRPALLMDAPPPKENVGAFSRVARHLLALGFSAPEILAEDGEAGLLIIEDFGDATFATMLADGHDENALYELAVDVLVELHKGAPNRIVPSGLARYDDEALLSEAFLLTDWYMPSVLGRLTSPGLRQGYAESWMRVFCHVHDPEPTLVLRDYHIDNLMILPERNGVASCGLLDFQDALAGSAAYDLMSLVEDARRDIDPGLAAHIRARYEAAFPGLDRARFGNAFAVLAAQRHAKVIGIFTRLWLRDGKPYYLVHIPRLWGLLERALEHPALEPVANWISANLPPQNRRVPEQ
ncbi:MAG: phosphotransferase [Rhodospirillales bacterium]|nr:phosphotransferase [Rhodospirillales bacterium]